MWKTLEDVISEVPEEVREKVSDQLRDWSRGRGTCNKSCKIPMEEIYAHCPHAAPWHGKVCGADRIILLEWSFADPKEWGKYFPDYWEAPKIYRWKFQRGSLRDTHYPDGSFESRMIYEDENENKENEK